MSDDTKRYLVIVRMGSASTFSRIQRDITAIVETFRSLSTTQPEPAFSSNDLHLLGLFILSAKPIAVIRAAFETCSGTFNGDDLLIVEVGADFICTQGFSRALTWLQRH